MSFHQPISLGTCLYINGTAAQTATQTPLSISTFLPSTSSALHSSFQLQAQSLAAIKTTLLAMAAMAVLLGTVSAVTYGVGEPGGSWALGTDYNTWVADKKFQLGDEIVFKYSSAAHDVVEVNKAGYDSCNPTGAINTFKSGNDVIPLNVTGTRYFICGITGHCSPIDAASMKVVIDVASGSTSALSPMPAAGPGASNSPPAPPSSAATSGRATAEFGLALLAAGLNA